MLLGKSLVNFSSSLITNTGKLLARSHIHWFITLMFPPERKQSVNMKLGMPFVKTRVDFEPMRFKSVMAASHALIGLSNAVYGDDWEHIDNHRKKINENLRLQEID